MAILELTKQNLVKLNFDSEQTEKLLTWDKYSLDFNLNVFASNIEKKIYTERDYYTRTYNKNSKPIFPFNYLDLTPEYYGICLIKYLGERKTLLGRLFVEQAEKEIFKQNEIKKADAVINHYKNLFKSRPKTFEKHSVVIGKSAYKTWLENTPQRTETKTETEQEQPTFVNNFDKVKPVEIYEHFKAGLVEKGYLTEQELNEYLKTAFELQTIPETLFKIKNTPSKQKIYIVFYTYYKDVSGKIHETQKQYVELLGNYFEGYNNETISTNWAREYKAKR